MTSASQQVKSKKSPTKTKPEKPFSVPSDHTDFLQSIHESFPPSDVRMVLKIDTMQPL